MREPDPQPWVKTRAGAAERARQHEQAKVRRPAGVAMDVGARVRHRVLGWRGTIAAVPPYAARNLRLVQWDADPDPDPVGVREYVPVADLVGIPGRRPRA